MLALIAGRGNLPARLIAALPTQPLIVMLQGNPPDAVQADLQFRIETIGTLFADLHARGVREICLCGAIDRPQLDPAALDAATAPLAPILMQAARGGDDAALRAILSLFEQSGFRIRAAHEIAPQITAQTGILSRAQPDAQMRADAMRGAAVLAALAPLDVGQAVVVGQGQVLGIETIAGTDALLATLPEVTCKPGAILIKAPKTGQDMRADMPAIGPNTLISAAKAGLGGVVINAGGVIMLEPERCIQTADEHGLVLWSWDGR